MSTAGASTTARGRCWSTPFPDATIPVVQLSINANKPMDHHLQLGAKLAPLRPHPPHRIGPQAERDALRIQVTRDRLASTPAYDDLVLVVRVDGYAYGSLSMTAYTVGLSCPNAAGEGGSPQPPADLPPDGSNI
jgi:4,5-DOPA dioxygenase extradiol